MNISKMIIVSSIVLVLFLILIAFYFNRWMMLSQLRTVSLEQSLTKKNSMSPLDNILFKHSDFFLLNNKNQSFVFQHSEKIQITKLWFDRCETTQKDFSEFTQWSSTQNMSKYSHPDEPKDWVYSSTNRDVRVLGRALSSVTGVSYYDAFAYCKTVGGRLPSYREWQAAAMGKQSYLYTWGNQFDDKSWPYEDPLLNSMQTCQSSSNDTTPDRIANLSSHVSEWTVGQLNKPAISGGNGEEKPYAVFALNVIARYRAAETRSNFVGFRCVYDKKIALTPWHSVIDSAPLISGEYNIGVPKDSFLPLLIQNSSTGDVDAMKALFMENRELTAKRVTMFEISIQEYHYFLKDIFVKWRLYANSYEPLGHEYAPKDWQVQLANKNMPVRNIDWWSAYAFSRWAGGRLPSEQEWVLLATNNDSTDYPWGNIYEPVAITLEKKYFMPENNMTETFDVNRIGVKHLSGNLSEWTSTLAPGPSGNRMIVKGGNYMLPGLETSSMLYANYFLPGQSSPNTGFRVVFD